MTDEYDGYDDGYTNGYDAGRCDAKLEIDNAYSEADRLLGALKASQHNHLVCLEANEKLEGEIERLRAALREIADDHECTDWRCIAYKIAKEALNEDE